MEELGLKVQRLVTVVDSAKGALDIIDSFKPDLILLDLIMKGMDGFEFLEIIKASDRTRSIPVIVISSLKEQETEEKVLMSGAVDYIIKPVNHKITLARIATHQRIAEQMLQAESDGLHDQLTGLLNRRSFDLHIDLAWENSRRNGQAISVLMIDIDDFKLYNDTQGHARGDLALCAVAKAIKSSLMRAVDKAFRWGGEEFSAILPGADLPGGVIVAERIRKEVEKTPITHIDGAQPFFVTVSIGVSSTLPSDNLPISTFVRQADLAMYKAKGAGKNRVAAWE